MATIIKPAIPKQVTCEECSAVIGYLPEEVEGYGGTDYGGGPEGFRRVKCPREGCPGYGYIERW